MNLRKTLRNTLGPLSLCYAGMVGSLVIYQGIYLAMNSEPMKNPPAWYHEEWERVTEHMGETGRREPRYYRVKKKEFPCIDTIRKPPFFKLSTDCKGYYLWGGFLFLSEEGMKNVKDVRHEMFHDLRIWDDDVVEYLVNNIEKSKKR